MVLLVRLEMDTDVGDFVLRVRDSVLARRVVLVRSDTKTNVGEAVVRVRVAVGHTKDGIAVRELAEDMANESDLELGKIHCGVKSLYTVREHCSEGRRGLHNVGSRAVSKD
jgi:hypothetical protein